MATTAAHAQSSYDYCVACTAPQSVYLCTVGPRQPDPGPQAWANYCAERIRADAGHQYCSALPLESQCQANRAVVFRGTQATPQQAEALVSEQPEERRSAAAEIWQQTVDGMQRGAEAVGRSWEESATAVSEGAESVGEDVMEGLRAVGEGMTRGTECVITLGERC